MFTRTTTRPRLTLASSRMMRIVAKNVEFVRPSGNVPPYGRKVFMLTGYVPDGSKSRNLPKGLVGTVLDRVYWEETNHSAWKSKRQVCPVLFEGRGVIAVPVEHLSLDFEE